MKTNPNGHYRFSRPVLSTARPPIRNALGALRCARRMLSHRCGALAQFAKIDFLTESTWREADDNFCRVVEPITEGAGQSSGNAGKAGNDWLAGHNDSPFWAFRINS